MIRISRISGFILTLAFVVVPGCKMASSPSMLDADGKVVAPDSNGNVIVINTTPGFAPPLSSQVAFILTDQSRRVDSGGQALSESDCIGALMTRGYRVVERAKLDSIIKEQLRRESGLMNEGDAVSAGKFANAQGIIIVQVANLDLSSPPDGTQNLFSRIKGDIRLTARWLDVESGVVYWNAIGTRKIDRVSGIPWIGNALGADVNYRDELTNLVRGTLQKLPQAGTTAVAAGG